MKKNLSKIALLLFSIGVLMSCSSDDNNNDDTDKRPYYLESVMWKLDATDREELVEEKLPLRIITNETNTPISVSINPYAGIKETSLFESDDMDVLNKWSSMDTIVNIPTNLKVLNSEYGQLSSSRTAPLYAGTEIKTDAGNTPYIFVVAEPNTKAKVEMSIVYRRMTARYKALFITKDRHSYVSVTGRWRGWYVSHPKATITHEKIN